MGWGEDRSIETRLLSLYRDLYLKSRAVIENSELIENHDASSIRGDYRDALRNHVNGIALLVGDELV